MGASTPKSQRMKWMVAGGGGGGEAEKWQFELVHTTNLTQMLWLMDLLSRDRSLSAIESPIVSRRAMNCACQR